MIFSTIRMRCTHESCNKKLKLVETTTNKCKCEGIYCRAHLEPVEHKCQFDFKKEARDRLQLSLPQITHEKVPGWQLM